MARREGQFLVEDFFVNQGGLNTSDSPFVVEGSQATGGKNFDYIKRGGIQKRAGHSGAYDTADTQLKTIGLGLYDKPSESRFVVRAAGTKLQNYDTTTTGLTNLTLDTTAAPSDFLENDSIVPVCKSMFNTSTSGVLWLAGGGMDALYGVFSGTKVTKNGVPELTGSVSVSIDISSGTGVWAATGTYRYAFALRKTATQAISNVALEVPATFNTLTYCVDLDLSTIGAVDSATYDKIVIYRSALSGAVGFTTGDLVAYVDVGTTTYKDTGAYSATAQNIPRAGNTVLDNSVLPTGDYSTLTTYKRRLVTASGSSVYISDVIKPESWPLANYLTIPSGGDITGLAVISQTTAYSDGVDELLVVFKQSELWVITGTTPDDFQVKFIDNSGAPNQPVIVSANGYLAWINYRGVFMWDGSGKPAYISQPIEDKWARGGDIDKSRLAESCGAFVQERNEIQWFLSSNEEGAQKYCLKLDLRLTTSAARDATGKLSLRGVFTPDVSAFPVYAALPFITSASASAESYLLGDNAGFLYNAYASTGDGDADIDFVYDTPFYHFGTPGMTKAVSKVVLWVLDTGFFDVSLDYWADYRYSEDDQSSGKNTVSANPEGVGLTWEEGQWDVNYWDTSSNKVKPLIYNLTAAKNNTQGDAFKFRIRQSGSSERLTIYGFSIYYTEIGSRK